MAEESDLLAWAVRALRDPERQARYRVARRYYDGDHRLEFATTKFRNAFGDLFRAVADNLCPAVVDSVSDRLRVTGVEASGGSDAELARKAWAIWERNRMDVRAPETHHEALLTGDGWALVDDQAGEAVIWPIPASDMAVFYDPNKPGHIRRAARYWFDWDEMRAHVDVFTSEATYRWVSRTAKRSSPMWAGMRAAEFEPFVGVNEGGAEIDSVQENRLGRVAAVHFPNRAFHCYGMTELRDVFPLQDALNKTLCDMLVAQEFSAYRQRWATGIDVGDIDEATGKPVSPPFDTGSDRVFTNPDPEGKFGDFSSTDLSQYVQVQENLRSEIARVSGTPLHYLFITRGDFPSGEAMKSAEARFTRKVEQRQQHFGNQWEDVLALALEIESGDKVDGDMLSLEWEDASPMAVPTGPSGAQPGIVPETSTTQTVI